MNSLWAFVLIAAAAAIFVFLIAPALLIFYSVFHRKKAIPFEKYNQKKYQNHYYIPYLGRIAEARDFIRQYPVKKVWAKSRDGLRLYGEYYDNGSRRTAILFHGIGAEIYTNLSSQARFLYKNGFNVLLACHRGHVPSEGGWTTIGLREQYDVRDWALWAEQNGAEDVLLYGVSMGGASIALASDKLGGTNVRAMVVDSGFYSVYEQMRRDARKMHIPRIMLPAQWILAKLFLRVDLKTCTADSLKNSSVPVLFIHGTEDETVECRWSKVNFDACSAPEKLLIVDGAPHTLSLLSDEKTVSEALTGFINEYFK